MRIQPIQRKLRKALLTLAAEQVPSADFFIRGCYYLTHLLRWLSLPMGVATVAYVCFCSNYATDLLYLLLTVGMPWLLSYIPQVVYLRALPTEYSSRADEMIQISPDWYGFVYDYKDTSSDLAWPDMIRFYVDAQSIRDISYNRKMKLLTIQGTMTREVHSFREGHGWEPREETKCEELSLLNVYSLDLVAFLQKFSGLTVNKTQGTRHSKGSCVR